MTANSFNLKPNDFGRFLLADIVFSSVHTLRKVHVRNTPFCMRPVLAFFKKATMLAATTMKVRRKPKKNVSRRNDVRERTEMTSADESRWHIFGRAKFTLPSSGK